MKNLSKEEIKKVKEVQKQVSELHKKAGQLFDDLALSLGYTQRNIESMDNEHLDILWDYVMNSEYPFHDETALKKPK